MAGKLPVRCSIPVPVAAVARRMTSGLDPIRGKGRESLRSLRTEGQEYNLRDTSYKESLLRIGQILLELLPTSMFQVPDLPEDYRYPNHRDGCSEE